MRKEYAEVVWLPIVLPLCRSLACVAFPVTVSCMRMAQVAVVVWVLPVFGSCICMA